MLIVMKFGGSSLATNDRIENVAQIIMNKVAEGNRVVVVVSAQGKTTDALIEKGKSVSDMVQPRENDVLLSAGEQMSSSLVAMKLNAEGCAAVSLLGWQAGIMTDANHGNASITDVNAERIISELDKGNVVVVAGFQGVDGENDITTLGRGGSDTTAIALAAALGADICYIYTDVSGVFSANPSVASDAVKHDEISYDEMLEMSSLGAKVLHNRSVSMAKRSGVEFEVRSSFDDKSGTKIRKFAAKKDVTGIVCDSNIAMITVSGIECGESTCRLFELLADKNIPIDVIIRSQGSDKSTGTVCFSVASHICGWVSDVINAKKDEIGFDLITAEYNMAKVSAVGLGLADSCSVAAVMLSELNALDIHPRYITTGEIRISVIIPRFMAQEAEKRLNSAFFGKKEER